MILIPFFLLLPLTILARKFLCLDDEDGHGGDVHGGGHQDVQPTDTEGDLSGAVPGGDVPGGSAPGGDHDELVVLCEQSKTTVGKLL